MITKSTETVWTASDGSKHVSLMEAAVRNVAMLFASPHTRLSIQPESIYTLNEDKARTILKNRAALTEIFKALDSEEQRLLE